MGGKVSREAGLGVLDGGAACARATRVPRRRGPSTWILLALAYVSTLAVPAGVVAAPQSMVTDVQGGAWQVLDGRKEPLRLLDSLNEGAVLGVDRGARIVVTAMHAPVEYELSGPSRAEWRDNALVGRHGHPPVRRSVEVGSGAPYRLEPVNLAQASVVMRSGEAEARDLVLREPVQTNVADTRVTFRWRGPGGPYVFELLDDAGRSLVRTVVKGEAHRLNRPELLRPGTSYQWRVSLRDPLGRSFGAWAEFGVLGSDVIRRLDATRPHSGAPFSRRLTYAAFLYRTGLRDEARERFRLLADERPESARLRTLAK